MEARSADAILDWPREGREEEEDEEEEEEEEEEKIEDLQRIEIVNWCWKMERTVMKIDGRLKVR